MMARIVNWDDEPFALLVESPAGDYLMPPIVLGADGALIEGIDVLAAVVESGIEVPLPIVCDASPGVLAEIDRRMAQLSDELGVPIGLRG